MADLCAEGGIDQANPPLLANCTVWNLHTCAMHAITAFGKDLCQFLCMVLNGLGEEALVIAKVWLAKHHITVNLKYLKYNFSSVAFADII